MNRLWVQPLLGIHLGIPSNELLGIALAILAPFVGMYLFVVVANIIQSYKRDVVGPHVVVPVDREYGDRSWVCYRCKYCNKEFERKEFFRDEDCDQFKVNS